MSKYDDVTFYDRYARICKKRKLDPCAQSTVELFGTTRSNVTNWKNRGSTPNGALVASIAATLRVSADYLLGLVDDPDATSEVTTTMAGTTDPLVRRIESLDTLDRARVIAYVDGLLTGPQYQKRGRHA